MWRLVDIVLTDISEDRVTFIFPYLRTETDTVSETLCLERASLNGPVTEASSF
jgi:hypothetical protein